MILLLTFPKNVLEFGLRSCGLCLRTLKSWHILRNFRKICGFGAGPSQSVECVVVFSLTFLSWILKLRMIFDFLVLELLGESLLILFTKRVGTIKKHL